MDTQDLFQCVRRGDLQQLQYLVEHKEVDLNVRDAWDSTPLYYACLCGHRELVEYLLDNGSACDANTFDGERCVYGALTNDIRKILLHKRVLTPHTMRREAYSEFLRRLLDDGTHKDVVFNIHGEKISAHRCILTARSSFLSEMFQEKWTSRKEIIINNSLVTVPAFHCLLEWLYTAQVKVDIKDVSDFTRLAKYCKLEDLEVDIERAFHKATSFVTNKRGAKIQTLYLDSKHGQDELQQDLGVMSAQAMPLELRYWNAGMELPGMPTVEQRFVDVIFLVEGYRFCCHKPIFYGRSEYFRALIDDHFAECEMDDETKIPIVPVHQVSPVVFSSIVSFVYTNTSDLSDEIVYDVLCTADMFFLAGLKKLCGNWLVKLIDTDTVMDILHSARLFKLARLEDQCTEFIARNIDVMFTDQDLHRMVEADAKEVKDREETDSITIIDDVRAHIRGKVRTMSDMEEAEHRLNFVDILLAGLGLDA